MDRRDFLAACGVGALAMPLAPTQAAPRKPIVKWQKPAPLNYGEFGMSRAYGDCWHLCVEPVRNVASGKPMTWSWYASRALHAKRGGPPSVWGTFTGQAFTEASAKRMAEATLVELLKAKRNLQALAEKEC